MTTQERAISRERAWILTIPDFGIELSKVWIERADEITKKNIVNAMTSGYDVNSIKFLNFTVIGSDIERIFDFDLLPGGVALPVVSDFLRASLLPILPTNEVAFIPVNLLNVHQRMPLWALAPTLQRPCTDLSKSSVSIWAIPGSVALRFKRMHLREDALEKHKIARNSNCLSQVIVCDEVRRVFESVKSVNFEFVTHI